MLVSHELAIKASTIRARLAELAGTEGDLGDEQRAEISAR